MFRDRVVHHFHNAGWIVDLEPALESPDGVFRPDILITKGAKRKAVLIRADEPPGPFEIAKFGASCKRARTAGVIVAPDDPSAYDLCDQAGLEFVAGEGIGEVVVVGHAPAPPPMPIDVAPRASVLAAEPTVATPARTVIPAWRWAIVALIWIAAVAVVAYDVYLYSGR